MSVDKTQRVLTAAQKKEAIALFNKGLQTYTQISSEMKVPYQAVNTFMTKWKYKKGILLKRATRSDKKVRQVPVHQPRQVVRAEPPQDGIITKLILDELKFLREFYKTTVDSMQAVMLRNEMDTHHKRNAH